MISNKTAGFAINKSYVARPSGDIPSKLSLLVRGRAGCVIPHSLPSGVDCPLKRRGLELNCRAMGDMDDDTVVFLAFCCIGWTRLEGLERDACPVSRHVRCIKICQRWTRRRNKNNVFSYGDEDIQMSPRFGVWDKFRASSLYVSYTSCWSSTNSYWGSLSI